MSLGMQSVWSQRGTTGPSPLATGFVAEHREQFSVRAMCRCLRIQPSGFYTWLKAPLSARAQEDRVRLNCCTKPGPRAAMSMAIAVYGYRKLHDDLIDQGVRVCPNRVARAGTA